MKKADLLDGMVIENDKGEKRLVWKDRLIDERGYIPMAFISDDLRNTDSLCGEHIVKVYDSNNVGYISDFFNYDRLTLLWERKSPKTLVLYAVVALEGEDVDPGIMMVFDNRDSAEGYKKDLEADPYSSDVKFAIEKTKGVIFKTSII